MFEAWVRAGFWDLETRNEDVNDQTNRFDIKDGLMLPCGIEAWRAYGAIRTDGEFLACLCLFGRLTYSVHGYYMRFGGRVVANE